MRGTDLRRARQRLGWTQQQLADALGVARGTVNRWERDVLGMSKTTEKLIALVLQQHRPRQRKKGGTQ